MNRPLQAFYVHYMRILLHFHLFVKKNIPILWHIHDLQGLFPVLQNF